MQKKLITLLLLTLAVSSIAQSNQTSKIGLYKWTQVVLIKPCDLNGKDLTTTTGTPAVITTEPEIPSEIGQQFRVLKIIDGMAVIQILDYTSNSNSKTGKIFNPRNQFYVYNFRGSQADYNSLADAVANSRQYGRRQAYFKVGINIIDELAEKQSKIKGSLAAGVINFPFKFRPQKSNTDFTGAFNFGAGIGYTFPHKSWRQFTHSIISGYSISNIVLDSSNTNKNQGKLASTNNFSAFSFSIGYLIQYQKVQAGIFIGSDQLSKINQRQFAWQYQSKLWISVGFGIAIFSGDKEKTDNNQTLSQND